MIAPARMASASPRRLTDRVPGRRQIARHVSQVVLMSWPIAQRYRSEVQTPKVGYRVGGYSMMAPPYFPLRHARQMGLQPAATFGLIVLPTVFDRLWRLPRRIAVIQDHPFERPSRRRHPRYNGISTCKGTDDATHHVASAVRRNPPESNRSSPCSKSNGGAATDGAGPAARVCDHRLAYAAPRLAGGRKVRATARAGHQERPDDGDRRCTSS